MAAWLRVGDKVRVVAVRTMVHYLIGETATVVAPFPAGKKEDPRVAYEVYFEKFHFYQSAYREELQHPNGLERILEDL